MKTIQSKKVLVFTMLLMSAASTMAFAGDEKKSDPASVAQKRPSSRTEVRKVPFLGVHVERLHPAFWAHLRDVIEHKQGLLVVDVAEGSPAAKAGIKPDDILLTYGDQKLFSPEQLAGLVRDDKVGHAVKLGIIEDGKSKEASVTLAEHVASDMRRAPHHMTGRMPMMRRQMSRTGSTNRTTEWESFDSLAIKRIGTNRYRAEIGYETNQGEIAHRKFEGSWDEIRTDIMSQKNLPDDERQHLLRSLNLEDDEFDFPRVYYTPDGRMIWEIPAGYPEF